MVQAVEEEHRGPFWIIRLHPAHPTHPAHPPHPPHPPHRRHKESRAVRFSRGQLLSSPSPLALTFNPHVCTSDGWKNWAGIHTLLEMLNKSGDYKSWLGI